MNKTLLKSVREYKKQSILAPMVILEVLMEVLIPMEMANIIDIGMTSGDLHYIIQRGGSYCYGNVIPVFRDFSWKYGSRCRCRICKELKTRYILQSAGVLI